MQEIKYKGNYITVTEENIDGHIFERVKLRRGVHLIPYKEGKIMLIHENRRHEDGSRWKLVSGWIDKKNKNILDHAIEELAEETGYEAKEWKEIHNSENKDKTVSYGTYYFVCEELSKLQNSPKNPDGDVILDCDWFLFDEIFKMILDGKILKDHSIMVALSFLYEQDKKSV